MLHHLPLPAADPHHVARVLVELLDGTIEMTQEYLHATAVLRKTGSGA